MFTNFELNENDRRLLDRVVNLVCAHDPSLGRQHTAMDLTATHNGGCPLDLERMAETAEHEEGLTSVMHDIRGIDRYLDRRTGELTEGFCPRFARPENPDSE